MSMPLLPSEVLEIIFSFLDGQSFCIARGVCKTWNIVIKDMQLKKSYWKNFCFREIPVNVLEEILGFKCKVWEDIEWMSIYKKWFNSRMLKSASNWKKKICLNDISPITCVCLSGSWVITGHMNGLICVWNLESGEMSQSYFCHLKAINSMALVDLLNLGSYYGSEVLPWSHHHMITISKDRYINISLLLEPLAQSDSHIHLGYHTDDLKKIKIFGDIFAVQCQDNTLSLWKMKIVKHPSFNLEVKFIQKIVGPEDYLLSIGLWHDEVQCVSPSGKLKYTLIHENAWTEDRHLKAYSAVNEFVTIPIIAIDRAYLFREKTVIMLTSDGKMIVSLNKDHCRYINVYNNLRTEIITIALYGSILALGGESGRLYLYYIFSEEELSSINLTIPDLTLKLSEASIISIDIFYEDDSPVVAASTTESIYIVKWYRSSTSHQKLKKRALSDLFELC